jgi:DNA-binding MarR family transcriptional regulator
LVQKDTQELALKNFSQCLAFLRSKGLDDLTNRQLSVLFACQTEPQTVRGMAFTLGLHKPSITRAIDKLVIEDAETKRKPFLARKEDSTDRRSVIITITKAGSKLISDLMSE